MGELDRYIGYYRPYATSHDDYDDAPELVIEVRNVAKVLAARVDQLRGGVPRASAEVRDPRPK